MGQVCEKLAGGNQLIAGEPLMQPGYGNPGYGQPGYGQPGYGQTGYVQSGLQPCFKCNGKASLMTATWHMTKKQTKDASSASHARAVVAVVPSRVQQLQCSQWVA